MINLNINIQNDSESNTCDSINSSRKENNSIYVCDTPVKDSRNDGASENLVALHFLSLPPRKQPTRIDSGDSVGRKQGTRLVSCNIEGVKHNAAYFHNLCKD